MSEYERVHHAARKELDNTCAKCGSSKALHAALCPNVDPAKLKIDSKTSCFYSAELTDYQRLCVRCHRRQDLVEGRPRCAKGHLYTPENTRIKAGARVCRACHRNREAARLAQPDGRDKKRESDRRYRQSHLITNEQKMPKLELQRQRRAARFEHCEQP